MKKDLVKTYLYYVCIPDNNSTEWLSSNILKKENDDHNYSVEGVAEKFNSVFEFILKKKKYNKVY